VLDYWIGPTRGLALAKEFRQLRPEVPIIMLSGYASLPNEIDGVADRWIIKGGQTENLLQTLESLLSKTPRSPQD
jgi:DNA-binding response OmpR family regulator